MGDCGTPTATTSTISTSCTTTTSPIDEPIPAIPLVAVLAINHYDGFLPAEDNGELDYVVNPNPMGMHLNDEEMVEVDEEEDEDLLILMQDGDEDMDDDLTPFLTVSHRMRFLSLMMLFSMSLTWKTSGLDFRGSRLLSNNDFT